MYSSLATINKLELSKERIKHIMEKEIPAVVPNFELKEHELTTTAYPEIESECYVGITSRKKRFIIDLISLGNQGFTTFNTNRKVNQLKKGMKKLFEQQHHLENNVVRLEDDMISLAHVAIEGLQHLLLHCGHEFSNVKAHYQSVPT